MQAVPWKLGPWEFDTHDAAINVNQEQINLLKKNILLTKDTKGKSTASKSAKSSRKSTKQGTAQHSAAAAAAVEVDEEADGEYIALDNSVQKATNPDNDEDSAEDEVIDDYLSGAAVPEEVQRRLIQEWRAAGKPTTHTNSKGEEQKLQVKFFPIYKAVPFPAGFFFGHIIIDECHTIRNRATTWSRLLRIWIKAAYKARADSDTNPATLVMVSATPAINRRADYRGISSLFWENMNLPPELWIEDPYARDSHHNMAQLAQYKLSTARQTELTQAFDTYGWRFWHLADWSGHDEGEIVPGLLQCICLRRGMDTITRLPNHADGSEWLVCPRDGIPPHRIETHELGYGGYLERAVQECMDMHFQNLVTKDTTLLQPDAIVLPGDTTSREAVVDEQPKDSDDVTSRLDGGLLRVLTIASMCWLSFEAMTKDDYIGSQDASDILEELNKINEAPAVRARTRTQQAVQREDMVIFGAEHTEAILQGTADNGLTYLQHLAYGSSPIDFIPFERQMVIGRVCCKSPVNTHVLNLVAERAANDKRTLVMVATPWEQL